METKQKPNERRRTKPRQISARKAHIKQRGRRKYRTISEWAKATLTSADIEAWNMRERRQGLDDDLDGGCYKPISGYRSASIPEHYFSRNIFLAYCRGEEIASPNEI